MPLLLNLIFQFNTQSFTTVTLNRTSGVSQYTEELVYVQCRGDYASQPPSLYMTASLYPDLPIDWNAAGYHFQLANNHLECLKTCVSECTLFRLLHL